MKTIKIRDVGGRTAETLQQEIERGGRFVEFDCIVSVFFLSFRFQSSVFYIPPLHGGGAMSLRAVAYSMCSLFLGAWGIPWGLLMTPTQILRNVAGLAMPPAPEQPSRELLEQMRLFLAEGAHAEEA